MNGDSRFTSPPLWRHAMAVAVALAWANGAAAATIDTGNPDLTLRWDNSIRLNAGWRVDKIDPAFGNSPNFDAGNYKFGRGDMFTQRADLLSELDLTWQRKYGVRVSGAAWYDHAYRDDKVVQNPGLPVAANPSTYDNGVYSSQVKRFYHQGAEFLDAFAFANLDAGDVPVSLRAGQFTTFWGTALFFQGGIARGQHPLDGRKSQASPGTETKELFLPLKQVSVQAQLTETIAVGAQYYFDWKSTRASEGGTYFGGSDFALDGPDSFQLAPSVVLRRVAPLEPEKKRGNFGVYMKFSPEVLGGQSLGVYYRKYDEKTPWLFRVPPGNAAYRTVYATDAELLGLSFDGKLGTVAVGAELGYHKNVGLAAPSLAAVNEGARGNTWHAVVNGIYGLPTTPLWESGTLAFELNYTKLDKVTKNEALFNRLGAASCLNRSGAAAVPGGVDDGCATGESLGLGVSFTANYPQIFPGVDLSVPIAYQTGISGNSPSALGTNKGAAAYSVGLTAEVYRTHLFSLVWADSSAPTRVNAAGVATGGNGSAFMLTDRGRVTMTYKYSF